MEEAYRVAVELLKNIKKLEAESENQNSLICEQNLQMKFLNNGNSYLKTSNKLSVNYMEQLEYKISKLEQENVGLRVEAKVCQRKADALNANVEHLKNCCDELEDEISELNREIQNLESGDHQTPTGLLFAYCCLGDPQCPNFGKEPICSEEEEEENEEGIRNLREKVALNVLSVCKLLMDEKKKSLVQAEIKHQELEQELAMKEKYQQCLIEGIKNKKMINELSTSLYDEIRGENSFCRNCSSSMSSTKYSYGAEMKLPRYSNSSTMKQKCCMYVYLTKMYQYLRKKFESTDLLYWTDLGEATSIYTMYGGNFYLNNNEKFPSDYLP